MFVFAALSVQDYENEAERFRSILDLEDGLVSQTYKRSRLQSPALRVKGEVKLEYRLRPRILDILYSARKKFLKPFILAIRI